MTEFVIVDTSVWIDHFKRGLSEPHRSIFYALVDSERSVITDVIKYELLVGTRTSLEFDRLLEFLSVLPIYAIGPGLQNQFAQFGLKLKKLGIGGSFTDSSIAFLAQTYGASIFSFDRYFHKLGKSGIIETI